MAITTYSELQTAIDNFLARTDLQNRSPEFISICEARMSRELETRAQEKRVTSTTTADDSYVTLPTDMRKIRHVRLNTSPIRTLAFYTPLAADQEISSTGTGQPLYFSIVGEELYLRPMPDASYEIEILYVGAVPALTDSNTTNTILSRHPDAYLYGSLASAYQYLMDNTRQAQYDALFTRALNEIKLDDESSKFGGAAPQVQTQYGEVT